MLFINFKCANYYLGQSYKIPGSVLKKINTISTLRFLFQKPPFRFKWNRQPWFLFPKLTVVPLGNRSVIAAVV